MPTAIKQRWAADRNLSLSFINSGHAPSIFGKMLLLDSTISSNSFRVGCSDLLMFPKTTLSWPGNSSGLSCGNFHFKYAAKLSKLKSAFKKSEGSPLERSSDFKYANRSFRIESN